MITRTTFLTLALTTIPSIAPMIAEAQGPDVEYSLAVEPRRDRALLELTVGAGIVDRSSTGIGDPLLGMGYDQSFGPLGSATMRLFVEDDDQAYVRHGMHARVAYTAGPSLGVQGAAFRNTAIDLGYAGRVRFPCMSRGDLSVHLGGYLAITGLVADADRGDWDRPDMANETIEAARRYDHAGLGGALGLNLDAHYGAFIIGFGVDLHQYFGIDTVVARDLMIGAEVRLGGEIPI